ncbi:MAG: hypothetical protein ACJAZT_002062 [Gammaproteobacteria bacterium]|jgi:hypothetical protein
MYTVYSGIPLLSVRARLIISGIWQDFSDTDFSYSWSTAMFTNTRARIEKPFAEGFG